MKILIAGDFCDYGRISDKKDKGEYVNKTEWKFKTAFCPYSNRYLNALYIRGFLPDFRSQKSWLIIQNLIRCESHRERLLQYIDDKINTYIK